MTSVINKQNKLIKKYATILDPNKRKIIINILELFYNKFSSNYEISSSTGWLDNQIIFFLDPYYNNKYSSERREEYIRKLSKKLSNKEYKNVSLDKIVLQLFSWNKKELRIFLKNNLNINNKIGLPEKSAYQLGLRVRKNILKGGGSSDEYMLLYIKSLKNKIRFNKTHNIFKKLDKLNKSGIYNNFLEKNFKINEIYISPFTHYVDIEKLFVYLLNNNSEYLDHILELLNNYFKKFIFKKKNVQKITMKENIDPIINKNINDKKWIYTNLGIKYDNNRSKSTTYSFYKVIDNKAQRCSIYIDKNYIQSISFRSYEKNILTNITGKIKLYSVTYFTKNDGIVYKDFIKNIKNKKYKNILLNAIKDFNKNVFKIK
jgi:hypothetical protein